MSSEKVTKRSYELKRRAERQDETRQRIVEAAVALHSTVGPARTTVAAVAERAGVTRPTVYAHFPDAESLFRACSGHVREAVPPPDPEPWRAIAEPSERLRRALDELYAYYARLESLLDNVQRDAPLLPIVREVGGYRLRHLERVREVVLDAWPARGRAQERLTRAIGHALDFRTWQSLVRGQGCTPAEAAGLMVALAEAAAAGSRR